MRCPGCGYESFDLLETCKHCGAPMVATAGRPLVGPHDPMDELRKLRLEPERSASRKRRPGHRRRVPQGSPAVPDEDFVEMLDDDAIEVGEDDLDTALVGLPASSEADDGPLFRIDDDLFAKPVPGHTPAPDGAQDADYWASQHGLWAETAAELPGPAFAFPGEDHGAEASGRPIIDRDDEIPERFWSPEVAGIGRRSLALLVDQSFLMAVLGVFFLGAFIAVRLVGLDPGLLLAAAGLKASALPFALLAALLSLAYFGYFHGSTGRTPGKALVGIEVRTSEGLNLTWGQVILRWFGAAAGLACAGVGVLWAMFEPRRRGWADLVSGTVVARRRPGSGVEVPGR